VFFCLFCAIGEKNELDFEKMDPHMVATLLKVFLKELPDPLVPERLYTDFIRTQGSQLQKSLDRRPFRVCCLILTPGSRIF
jgi:hypothetical protein